MRINFGIFILILLLSACSSDDEMAIDSSYFGYDYYPLRIGQEHIYRIDSIIHDDFTGSSDTFSFQRRELIESTFIDSEGRRVYNVAIFNRENDTSSWNQEKLISRVRTEKRAEELDNNKLEIKMVFPLGEDKAWNANLLNTGDELRFSYVNVHQPLLLDTILYDSTAIVLQKDEQNLIEQFESSEVYSAGKGLIFRTDKELRTSIDGTIESGYEATLSLISFNRGN